MNRQTGIGRREFIGAATMAAGGFMTGCGTASVATKSKDDFIWAALFHMGTNMWCDQVPDSWGPYKGEECKLICAADHLRFDEKVWRSLTDRMVNWYYSREFDAEKLKALGKESYITYVKAYEDLDKAGFDQVPTGSNWSYDTNFAGTVAHCRKVCSPKRLKGFMMAPWFFTLPDWEKKNLEAIEQVGAVIKETVV